MSAEAGPASSYREVARNPSVIMAVRWKRAENQRRYIRTYRIFKASASGDINGGSR